jgi:hypothetical protein
MNMSEATVLSLFKAKEKQEEKKESTIDPETLDTFEQIMKRNRENEERQKRERAQANKSVLRSYRIKS